MWLIFVAVLLGSLRLKIFIADTNFICLCRDIMFGQGRTTKLLLTGTISFMATIGLITHISGQWNLQHIFTVEKLPPMTPVNVHQRSKSNRLLPKTGSQTIPMDQNKTSTHSRRFIIYTRFRSGSTFTSELFQNHPEINYLFEPLKLFQIQGDQLEKNFIRDHAAGYLDSMLNCQYQRNLNYAGLLSNKGLAAIDRWRCHLFDHMHKANRHQCKPTPYFQKICEQSKYSCAKTISLTNVNGLMPLLENGVKVLFLVRDPRSRWRSMQSIRAQEKRMSLAKYLGAMESKIRVSAADMCRNYVSEFERISNLTSNGMFLDNFRIIRYEDIAAEPGKAAKLMYQFLEIPLHKDVLRWIEKNTKTQKARSR